MPSSRSSRRLGRHGRTRMASLVVVERRSYRFVTSDIGVDLQITKIRFDGNIGFVREWRKSYPGESFMLSSNARLGHKADGNRIGREVLELAICKRQFTDAACAIAELDAMDREVLSSNRWSFEYARSVWNLAKALAPHKNPNERTTTMKKTKKTKTTGRKNKAVQKSIKDKLRATGASEKCLDKIHVLGFDDDDKKKSGPRPMGTKKPIASRNRFLCSHWPWPTLLLVVVVETHDVDLV